MEKILGVAYRFVSVNDDGVMESFIEGETVQIKKRNYEVEGGYETIEGVIDSIMPSTNELRIDCSKTNESKYAVVGFGQIIDITRVETGTDGEDTISITTIWELLNDLTSKVDEIHASCMACKKRHEDETQGESQSQESGSTDETGGTEGSENTTVTDGDNQGDSKP